MVIRNDPVTVKHMKWIFTDVGKVMMAFILATDFDFIAYMSKMAFFFVSVFTPMAFFEYIFRDVNLPLFGEIPLFFFTFRFFENDFPRFLKKSQKKKKKKKKKISFTDTATIDCSKSFGKQSVTSWFAGMRFFRFRSKFESAASPLGIRNLTLAAMLRVGIQRALPHRGGGEGDGLSNSSICTPSFSTLITLHTHTHTHTRARAYTHTRTHSLSLSLSLSHTHIHWHSGLPAAVISP